jgi:hypothetical protein
MRGMVEGPQAITTGGPLVLAITAAFGNSVMPPWSATRTLHPFWGNFLLAGDSDGTPDFAFQSLGSRPGDSA